MNRNQMRTAVVLCIAVALTSTVMSSASEEWKQWSCDELTPNLCNNLHVETGSLIIRDIPVKYWRYKRQGNPEIGDGIPLIALHGGPAWPHSYLLPLRQLACRVDGDVGGAAVSEVIFYDQAGCGQSTFQEGESVPSTYYPHLLDPAHYSEEELPALIEHWKLDKYHVLGHSWGSMLAQLFALNAKDTSGLQSLILSGPLSDSKSYIAAQWDKEEGNLESLPPFIQGRIKALAKAEAYESDEYKAINDVLTTFFTVRTGTINLIDCVASSANGLNKDIYVGMQGASEFAMSGVLEDFNVTGRLHEINVPVLLTHGVYDTMRPSIVKTMEQQLKVSERVLFPHSGHVSMIDDAGMMNDAVADFLQRVDTLMIEEIASSEGMNMRRGEELKESKTKAWLVTLAQVLIAFIAGLFIGRLGCNRNNEGYAQIY